MFLIAIAVFAIAAILAFVLLHKLANKINDINQKKYEEKLRIKQEREENSKREERYLATIDKFTDVLEKVNENLATNNKRLEYIEKKLSIGSDE